MKETVVLNMVGGPLGNAATVACAPECCEAMGGRFFFCTDRGFRQFAGFSRADRLGDVSRLPRAQGAWATWRLTAFHVS